MQIWAVFDFYGPLMPSSHLPRTPCDTFFYDFPCDFLGIVGGYGLRHMCSHCLRASCDFFYGASGATRGNSVQRLCRECTEIVQCQCSCRAVSAASARKSYGTRAGIGLLTTGIICPGSDWFGSARPTWSWLNRGPNFLTNFITN